VPETASAYLKASAAWAPTAIRLVLGVIFIAHGAQKLFGAFGGPGMAGTVGFFATIGIKPALLWAWVVALAEFFGGLAVLLGLLTGVASAVFIVNMLVAIALVHWKNGFFNGDKGFEFNLSLIVMALSLIFSGPGRLSLDRLVGWPF
jgi:putative oxidoreductase